MRTEKEIADLLARVTCNLVPFVKQRGDGLPFRGTIGIVGALEWVLGLREDSDGLVQLSATELAAAVRKANR